MSGYVVTATIHGPVGWADVVETATGKAVAVCQAEHAYRVAATLSACEGIATKGLAAAGRKTTGHARFWALATLADNEAGKLEKVDPKAARFARDQERAQP